jgi:hypothetical protein
MQYNQTLCGDCAEIVRDCALKQYGNAVQPDIVQTLCGDCARLCEIVRRLCGNIRLFLKKIVPKMLALNYDPLVLVLLFFTHPLSPTTSYVCVAREGFLRADPTESLFFLFKSVHLFRSAYLLRTPPPRNRLLLSSQSDNLLPSACTKSSRALSSCAVQVLHACLAGALLRGGRPRGLQGALAAAAACGRCL